MKAAPVSAVISRVHPCVMQWPFHINFIHQSRKIPLATRISFGRSGIHADTERGTMKPRGTAFRGPACTVKGAQSEEL